MTKATRNSTATQTSQPPARIGLTHNEKAKKACRSLANVGLSFYDDDVVSSPHAQTYHLMVYKFRRQSCISSRNALSFRERAGWRSLRRALASIWRMRSRV